MTTAYWQLAATIIVPLAGLIVTVAIRLERRITRLEDGYGHVQAEVRDLRDKGVVVTLCRTMHEALDERLKRLERKVWNGGPPA